MDDFEAHLCKGQCLYDLKIYHDAIACSNIVIKIQQDSIEAYVRKALALEAAGRSQEEVYDFTRQLSGSKVMTT